MALKFLSPDDFNTPYVYIRMEMAYVRPLNAFIRACAAGKLCDVERVPFLNWVYLTRDPHIVLRCKIIDRDNNFCFQMPARGIA